MLAVKTTDASKGDISNKQGTSGSHYMHISRGGGVITGHQDMQTSDRSLRARGDITKTLTATHS